MQFVKFKTEQHTDHFFLTSGSKIGIPNGYSKDSMVSGAWRLSDFPFLRLPISLTIHFLIFASISPTLYFSDHPFLYFFAH